MIKIKNIAIAGTGNVAYHLAKVFASKGYNISGVWSRESTHAELFAENFKTRFVNDISELNAGTDLIIIAVSDSAIKNVARAIGNYKGIVVHTAGSVSMDVFEGIFPNYGVFYPLQTLSREIPVSFDTVPIFVEASSSETLILLKTLAQSLSSNVYEADSHNRMLLHVAAVFAGNYSNLMYSIANELIHSSGFTPEVFHPLISETARKATEGDPQQMQTGPARRPDKPTIEKHLEAHA